MEYPGIYGMIVQVAGISYRQSEAKKCREGQSAQLVREPKNPHDPNAVAVWANNCQIGYIPAKFAIQVAEHMDNVGETWAFVHAVAGGVPGYYPTIGVTLKIMFIEDEPIS